LIIATATVQRVRFLELENRLELFSLCLQAASHKACGFVVFPGGYFRVPPKDYERLEDQLKDRVKTIGPPCIIGVDSAKDSKSGAGAKKPAQVLGRKKNKDKQSANDAQPGRPPEVWVVGNNVRRFQEMWGRPMKCIPGQRRTRVGNLYVLPLCCGDALIPDLVRPVEPVDLVAVTAHWSIWPIQWIQSLTRSALTNRAPVALAQHLVVLPGKNYVYDQHGNICDPIGEERLSTGSIEACLRFFNIPIST
jgi:hypothetical protein